MSAFKRDNGQPPWGLAGEPGDGGDGGMGEAGGGGAPNAANGSHPRHSHQTAPSRPLPARRTGWRQKATVGGVSVHLHTGEYEDGALGEFFLNLGPRGVPAEVISWANCWAIACSLALQHGCPLEELVDKFAWTRFEPAGVVGRGSGVVRIALSVPDYVMRELAAAYGDAGADGGDEGGDEGGDAAVDDGALEDDGT